MPHMSEREALEELFLFYERFNEALAVLKSHLDHPDIKSIFHGQQCETLREMRDRLLPLEVGSMPEVTSDAVPAPELTDQVLEPLQISRSKFPALCARLENLEFFPLADADSLIPSLHYALRQHGATMYQISMVEYALEASAALQAMLA